jgi:replication factor A1
MTEKKLLALVEQKKKKVGGGYLTDQGALFLVASDLGISLDYSSSHDVPLKEVFIGANNIAVKARLFAIYPAKGYEKKDGTKGEFRRIALFDGESFARLTLWDDKVKLIDEIALKVGDIVRISSIYVRSGLDGSPALNLGQKGAIEIVTDESIPSIMSRAKRPSQIKEIELNIVLDCIVKTQPRKSEYTTQDGRQGTLVQFNVGGEDGGEVRVVLWNNPTEGLLDLGPGSKIVLSNVRSKTASSGGLEVHGDEGTLVQIISQTLTQPAKQPSQSMTIDIEGNLLSMGDKRFTKNGLSSVQALMIGNDYKIYTIIAIGNISQMLLDRRDLKKVKLKGRLIDEKRIICDEDNSIETVKTSDKDVKEAVMTKLNKLADNSMPVFCEVISLAKTIINEIVTKEGETVRKAELIVGDETGETKVAAWREDVKIISGLLPGERLRLKGFQVQKGKDGTLSLLAKPYSSIERT